MFQSKAHLSFAQTALRAHHMLAADSVITSSEPTATSTLQGTPMPRLLRDERATRMSSINNGKKDIAGCGARVPVHVSPGVSLG